MSLDIFSAHFQEERFMNLLNQNFSTINLMHKFHSMVDEANKNILKENLVNYMEILEKNINYHGQESENYFVAQNDIPQTPKRYQMPEVQPQYFVTEEQRNQSRI